MAIKHFNWVADLLKTTVLNFVILTRFYLLFSFKITQFVEGFDLKARKAVVYDPPESLLINKLKAISKTLF